MPFPNEHAARQASPAQFVSFARKHPKGWPDGVDAIFGVRSDGKTAVQSIRFASKDFTPSQARTWLRDHGFTHAGLENASKGHPGTQDVASVSLELEGLSSTEDGKLIKIRMDVVKADAYKKQIFGWLYICRDCTGKQVVDHSGEVVSIGTLETASYKYVASHRKMGDMHGRTKDGAVVESGHLIECVVYTAEKRAAMATSLGHPTTAFDGLLPDGMWVGYQVTDAATFADVLSGGKRSLSFGGRARKVPVKE